MFRVSMSRVRTAGMSVAASSVLLALAPTAAPAQAQAPQPVPAAGHVLPTATGSRSGRSQPFTGSPRVVPFRTNNPSAHARAKAIAARRAAAAHPSASASPQAAVFAGLDKLGLTATQNAPRNQISPPDSTGAVGPTAYVEFVNDKVGVFGRSALGLISSADLDTFDGLANAFVFDVQIQFDPQSQRWFYVNDAIDHAGNDMLAFGFSKSADPSDLVGGWCPYFVNTDTAIGGTTAAPGAFFTDFPHLGHDNTHVTFGDNTFGTSGFVSAMVWSYPKPAAGTITTCPAGTSLPGTIFGSSTAVLKTSLGNTALTPIPANTVDSSPVDYVVSADSPSHVMAWELGGTATAPTLTADGDIAVTGYSLPANVPQPGSSNSLDTGAAELTQAVAHVDPSLGAGAPEGVWTQHTITGPGGYYSADRWYELLPAKCAASACPAAALHQQGNVTVANQFVFNGAISPAMDGTDAVIDYNVGSSTLLPEIRAQSRNVTDPLGTMSGEVTLGSSSAADQDNSCFNVKTCRWGDYAGATPDPSATNRVWGSSEIVGPVVNGNFPHWQTMNFALAADESPVASFTFAPPAPVHGSPVSFNAGASKDPDGSIIKYGWRFGDFTGATGATPSHTYAAPGRYSVTLTVTDKNGNSATTVQTIKVADEPPVASFTFSPASPVHGSAVSFDGSASKDPDGTISTYAWKFGDTTTGTGAKPSHTYTVAGHYTVTLTVTDSSGRTALLSKVVVVS